jgi:hypothetical protein
VAQLTLINDKEYETIFGIPFFKELSKKLELNKKADAEVRKLKEDVERQNKERQAKKEKLIEEKHARTQSFLSKSAFLNLIPSEIMPTYNFYMGTRALLFLLLLLILHLLLLLLMYCSVCHLLSC